MLHHIESGSGPAVVLLHAFPVDSTLWAPQRRALAAAGYRVITPDLPGFGGSAVSTEAPSVDVMADEVATLMDQMGIADAVVGGLSMGGYVAMAMLRRHPARISRLMLADTKASADTEEAAANRERIAADVVASGSTAGLADAMLANLLGETTRATRPEVVAAVRRWIGAQPAAAVAWAQRAMATRPDALTDLSMFGGPVLVVVGAEDTISPMADAEAMARAASAGGRAPEIAEIAAAGHLTAVENPDAVAAVLRDWLAATGGAS